MFKHLLICLLVLFMASAFGQKHTRFQSLYDSASKYEYVDYDLSFYYAKMALDNKDSTYSYDDQIGLNTMMDTYYQKRNMLDSAFSINRQSLKLATDHKDTLLIAYSLNNMAGIYGLNGNHQTSINIYKQALAILERIGEPKQIANTCYNLSIPYSDLHMPDSVLHYTNRAFVNYKKINDYSGLASCYGMYGSLADEKKNYKEAVKYYELQLENFKLANEPTSLMIPYENLADIYLKLKNPTECKKYLDIAMNLALSFGSQADINVISSTYSEYYELIGDYKTANIYLKRYYEGKDSMASDQLKTELSDMKSEFDRETSENLIKIQTLEAEQNLKSKETIKWVLIVSSVFFIIVMILFINRYRIKQKSFLKLSEYKNQLIRQKEKIEENQKEIIDSINYAKRIQSAILPKEEDIFSHFPESFLIYKPKNIVAGDFYFFETTATSIFYAAADCTGHGVPGALVSVVCSNALTRCVKEFNLTDPGKILDKTRELVLETFNKSGREVKDGMDISLCRFDINNKTQIQWAGANNPLWYVSGDNLMEVLPDKQPIGHSEILKPFTTHTLSLHQNDTIYLFTDGYAYQFGGPKGKKFKYKQLKDQLLLISAKKLSEQKKLIEEGFNAWKADLEQVDDVLVLAVKL